MKPKPFENNISKIIKNHNKIKNNDKKLEQIKISEVIEMKKKNIYALSSEYICSNKKKFMLIDFTILLIIIYYSYRFIFQKDTFSKNFLNEMQNQYRRYIHNELNLIILCIFFILMILFSTIALHEFQSLSIVLFVTFITSIFQKGDAFVLSASIAGIFVYFYYRIKILLYNKQNNKNCQKIITNNLHIPLNNQYKNFENNYFS